MHAQLLYQALTLTLLTDNENIYHFAFSIIPISVQAIMYAALHEAARLRGVEQHIHIENLRCNQSGAQTALSGGLSSSLARKLV